MVNQMGKFAPNLAEVTQPLRALLNKGNQWVWGEPQQRAFAQVKETLTSAPVLALFDPNLDTIISADASSFGLGAVLLQRQPSGDLKLVAYISRSMMPTEPRYAQIEKEALAFTWACAITLLACNSTSRLTTSPWCPLLALNIWKNSQSACRDSDYA